MIAACLLLALDLALPPLALAEGLDREMVLCQYRQAAEFLSHAEAVADEEDDPRYRPAANAVRDAARLRMDVYEAAWWATAPGRDPWQRRFALKDLIRLAGFRAVVTGEPPSPYPLEQIPVRP